MSKSSTTTTEAGVRPASLAEMRRAPTHPGEMFAEEFLKPLGISQAEAARRMFMSVNRLNTIVKGRRGVSAETAVLFAALTGTSAEFWSRLQADYDLWHAMQRMKTASRKVRPLAITATPAQSAPPPPPPSRATPAAPHASAPGRRRDSGSRR